jgi:eukaryotic-like serine/threonine-protein kinase
MTPSNPAEVPASPDRLRELVERFTGKWKQALGGGPRPSVDEFLTEASEPDRIELRTILLRVEQELSGSVTTDDQTVDYSGRGAADTKLNLSLTLDCVGETLDAPGAASAGESAPATGYEILGELGRGGMGVVYKARQVALNRVVALKMVLSGAHASQHQLERFRTEAEAIARFQHPHIVQIYEVGERDGLPFFSLEYLPGGSLTDQIKREPQPAERAARIAAQLARGIQYSHSHGIAHRDLKPANILFDTDGVPKITDFGLAKKLEAGAASHTQSGTIVGSPSYMAPEQARGDIHDVGPSADVYSLGAILYEMLTGRPPFLGSSLVETLEQVRTKEPVPPRELVPKVPRDLETIALKCLQKEPAKRYGTAAELADDLDRFRAGKPILARPVSNMERAVRWCKRNPRIAGLTAAVVVSLVVGTIVSTVLAIGMARERNQKEAERIRAEEARVVAEAATVQARKNAEEVLKQGKLALGSFGTLIDEVQKKIGDSPGTLPLKLKLLETALEGLDKVAKNDEDSRLLGQSTAAAYMKIGQLYQQMGQSEKAFAQYQRCHEIVRSMADKDPDGPVAQANLAASLTMLGEMSLELRRDIQTSLDYYQQALALRSAIVNRPPDEKLDPIKIRQDLSESHTRVGVTYLRLGEPGRATGYFSDALKIREHLVERQPTNLELQLDVARSRTALGEVRFRSRDWTTARDHFAKALEICDRAQQTEPDNPRNKQELANILGNFGVFLLRTADLPEAQKHLTRGQKLMDELVALDAKVARYQRYLALADYRCGTLARLQNDTAVAERWNRMSLDLRKKLADDDPKSERRQIELLLVQSRTSAHKSVADMATKILQKPNLDREVLVELAQCYSQAAASVSDDSALRQIYINQALDMLKRAFKQGYKDFVVLETEPDLQAIRDLPEFKQLIKDATTVAAKSPG